ncbi:hypothetical protein [Natronorubrum sulfidifaciens]|uniref:Uncharacterized protein n=1 Tax=Natronorubrum sulfidifaciens JCM 14089 TaxID=1230460 RepID=L9WJC6_9EURY|nr:hypothetical protein [Natronorubrum sulfidifaciens]ELY49482.1 hypothetical protein C495_00915 [Natronorubrum sulfidifaciens JCM 14089]
MTSQDRPTPPSALNRDITDSLSALEDSDAEQLRAAASYLETLAAWAESTRDDEQGSDATADASVDEADDADGDVEYPADVPERASVTVKEIAGTTYHYYQWRDGDRIESKTVQR